MGAETPFGKADTGQNAPMPRAIWSGAITFGLVNVSVRLYSADSEH